MDSFSWEAVLAKDATGNNRIIGWVQTGFKLADLKVSYNAGAYKYFVDWAKDFIEQGKCKEADHKTGSLQYYAQDVSEPIGSVTFSRIGINKSPDLNYDSSSSNMDHGSVGLYASGLVLRETSASADGG